jgi:integrase
VVETIKAIRAGGRNGLARSSVIRLPDGSRPRIEGTPSLNTKLAAENAERAHIERALRGEPISPPKEVPTFAEFAETLMATYARTNNKPSEYEGKRSILTRHLLPAFGARRLEEITGKDVDDLKAGLRLGELLAVEWTDIDFKNRLLTVMRNDWRGSIYMSAYDDNQTEWSNTAKQWAGSYPSVWR